MANIVIASETFEDVSESTLRKIRELIAREEDPAVAEELASERRVESIVQELNNSDVMGEITLHDIEEIVGNLSTTFKIDGFGEIEAGIELFDFYLVFDMDGNIDQDEIETSTHVSSWKLVGVHRFIEKMMLDALAVDINDYFNEELFLSSDGPFGIEVSQQAEAFQEQALVTYAAAIQRCYDKCVEEIRGYCDGIGEELTEDEFKEVCEQFIR